MASVTDALAEAVLRAEQSGRRFELFSNAVVSENEGGVPVLPTSRSWDLGRDGRSQTTSGSVYVCSSLTDNVDTKSTSDVRRLAENASPPYRIYFCSSQPLSESRCVQIEADIRKSVPPDVAITVVGREQLGHLAQRFPDAFVKFYAAELEALLAVLKDSVQKPIDDNGALRLALVGIGHESSGVVRR